MSHLSVELQQQMYNLFMTELNMWRKVSKWESLKEVVVSSKAHLPRICQINTSETPASEIKEQTNGCLAIMVGHVSKSSEVFNYGLCVGSSLHLKK